MDDLRFQTPQEMLSHYQAVRNRLCPAPKKINIAKREPAKQPLLEPPKELNKQIFIGLSTVIKKTCIIKQHGILSQDASDVFDRLLIPNLSKLEKFRLIVRWGLHRHEVRVWEMFGTRRFGKLAIARQEVWVVARELVRWSLPEIGRRSAMEGGRPTKFDHTTILHACRKVGPERAAALVADFEAWIASKMEVETCQG